MSGDFWKHTARAASCVLKNAGAGIAAGLGAGAVVGCFRISHDGAFAVLTKWLGAATGEYLWRIPLWFAVLCALAWIIGRLVRAEPLIPGSGIPQTELVLAGRLNVPPPVWPRLLLAKFAGSWLAVTAGLSLGREGPCIQMGGAVGAMLSQLWGKSRLQRSPAVLAGAAAGMAAAFGAPVAGFLLAFEEMKAPRDAAHLTAALVAAFTAGAVIEYGFGLGRLFPFEHFRSPALNEVWALLILGPALGVMGVLYNKSLLWLKDREARQTLLPQTWRLLPPLLAAGVLVFVCPQVLGGGDGLASSLAVPHRSVQILLLLFLLKFAFSLYSYTGNAPGGLLMPLVCLGALLGCLAGQGLVGAGLAGSAEGYIVLGMAGYFAAIVRAPLTGTALVVEMSGAYTCLPMALAVALLASYTATRLHCPPVYDSLKARVTLPPAAVADEKEASSPENTRT